MKTAIMPFNYNSQTLRTIADESGNPWFVLADVCAILELSNPSMVASRLDEDEKGISQTYTLGGMQNMTIISESGLYAVILRSDKPQAKPFRKWVTSEVLPSIRKTGAYHAPNADIGAIVAAEVARQIGAITAGQKKTLLPTQDACEYSVIQHLMKNGGMTGREFQAAKHRVKPWALIRPKSAIGGAMRATFADLEQKGVITRNGSHINLNTIH